MTELNEWEHLRQSDFSRFLMSLPDEIERARERGLPIRCPDPGTEHGRKLLLALGVEIEKPET